MNHIILVKILETIDTCTVNGIKKWITAAMRILKDNGTMYLMSSPQYMPYFDIFIQEKYHIVSRIIWNYDSSGVQSKIVVLY